MANISDHPEYGEARARFEADKRTAEQAGDDEALKRVNFDWEREVFRLERESTEREAHDRATAEAREAAKAELGDLYVEDVFGAITDPAKIKAMAESLNKTRAGQQQQGGDWGGGEPVTSTQQQAQQPAEVPYENFVNNELNQARGYQRERAAHADRVLDAVLQEKVLPNMGIKTEGEDQ